MIVKIKLYNFGRYTNKDGYSKNNNNNNNQKITIVDQDVEKFEPCALLVGM